MDSSSRHRCLVYKGSPSMQMAMLARVMREKLAQNHRCVYLNSPSMAAGMRSYLAAAGVDVARETASGSLMVSSEQHHLVDGRTFSVDRIMEMLEESLLAALTAGYAGLWATGDMTWELGPEIGSGKLLEYEWRLEQLMRAHPELSGICQYHVDTLPADAVRRGVSAHAEMFVNETLALMNPHHLSPGDLARMLADPAAMDGFIEELCGRAH